MTDILNTIDETLNSLDLCACGCGQRLGPRSASPWYAGEACQTRWMERGKEAYSRQVRARLLLHDVEPTIRPLSYWPAGPSVYDLMPDITEWLNANGIRAMDVPVGEVAQLHDGQITVWTFDRPRRIVSDAEGPARTLVTVPMVVAPPDSIQPWLLGQCRESLPFAAPAEFPGFEPDVDARPALSLESLRGAGSTLRAAGYFSGIGVEVDDTIPPDTIELRDPVTGAPLARITGLSGPGDELAEPVSFAVDVSRSGEAAVAVRGSSGHLWMFDFERIEAESDASPVDAAFDPALDHSSHSMQWVDGCPECPSAQDRPQRRTAAVTDLGWSTEVDAPRHVDTRGAGRFHTEQDGAGEWYEVPCDCPTEEPRRPWWRFW